MLRTVERVRAGEARSVPSDGRLGDGHDLVSLTADGV